MPPATADGAVPLCWPLVLKPVSRGTLPRLDPQQVAWENGILVRATNWLGDTVMSLPAVYKLRAFLPRYCGLFVATPEALAPIWRAVPWVDRVVPFAGRRLRGNAAAEVRRLRPGVAVVLPNSIGSALDVEALGIPLRLGRGGLIRRGLLTHTLPPWRHTDAPGQAHQLSAFLELVACFGDIPWDDRFPPLQIPAPEITWKAYGADAPGPWLMVAPGAAYGPAKQWPSTSFRAVVDWWLAHRNGRVLVVGAAADGASAGAVATGDPRGVTVAGRTTLAELMALLRRVSCVVANDSGVMHLAAGLGVPGVGVFGCTDPIAKGPLGGHWRVLQRPLDCAPCYRRVCPRSGDHCLGLWQISVAEVCDVLRRMPGEPE